MASGNMFMMLALSMLIPSSSKLLPGERDLSSYTFDEYKREFGKNHVGEEHAKRETIFTTHLDIIRKHNSDPSKTWFLTVNEFTDWSPEEFRATRTNHRPHPPRDVAFATELGAGSLQDLPDSLDWRTKAGVVTKPKNQGACGGCWAFSAAETLESHLAIATGKPAPELSTQQIISCTPNPRKCGGTGGCQGATQPLAFNYSEVAGITTEENYPFRQSTGTCDKSKIKPVAKNSGFAMLPQNNYTALMHGVATKGPIAISVAAGGLGWQLYGGGIMKSGPFNKGFDIDHAVQLVGYGEENGVKYWLVRNSWGSWGESGYIRIQRFGEGKEPCGMDNTPQDGMACEGDTKPVKYCGLCGILSSSSYPTGVQPAETHTSVDVGTKRHSRGYKRSQSNEILPVANLTAEDIANAPDSIDWSAKGATTPVKDQGQCGSCWAFSTTEGVESGVFMATGSLPKPLSTQELVACEKQDDGCDGGDIPETVKYLKKTGVATDAEYPDTSSKGGRTGKCKKNLLQPAVKVTGMQYAIPPCSRGDCSHQNEEALAAALAKYGPLSICINSGDGQSGDWDKYHGGILKGSCKAKASLTDHCVQLVGYDKSASQPYWKIRNSWGKSYGEEGFIRIPYGNGNECCVGCEAVIISATTQDVTPVVV